MPSCWASAHVVLGCRPWRWRGWRRGRQREEWGEPAGAGLSGWRRGVERSPHCRSPGCQRSLRDRSDYEEMPLQNGQAIRAQYKEGSESD